MAHFTTSQLIRNFLMSRVTTYARISKDTSIRRTLGDPKSPLMRPGSGTDIIMHAVADLLWDVGVTGTVDKDRITGLVDDQVVYGQMQQSPNFVFVGNKVGISTTAPTESLHVFGDSRFYREIVSDSHDITVTQTYTTIVANDKTTARILHTLGPIPNCTIGIGAGSREGQLLILHAVSGFRLDYGQYIVDTFESGSYDAWWDSDFTSSWTLSQLPPVTGEYAAIRGSDANDLLTPSGTLISGDFDLQWTIRFGVDNSGNVSEHLELYPLGSSPPTTPNCEVTWNNGVTWSNVANAGQTRADSWLLFSQYGSVRLRLARVDDVITAYALNPNTKMWETFANPYVFSGDFAIWVNGADKHGLGEFSFSSDSDFPNTYGTPIAALDESGLSYLDVAEQENVVLQWIDSEWKILAIGLPSTTNVERRVSTIASSANPTINTDNVDMFIITAQAENITSMTTNLSGSPRSGSTLWIAITGTAARSITWGTSFEASTVTLPTTTVSTNRLDVGFIWNPATLKWRCIAKS